MQNLFIRSENDKTQIFIDGFEISNVIGYEVKSSAAGTAELTLKIEVCVSELNFGNEIADNLTGNLSKHA